RTPSSGVPLQAVHRRCALHRRSISPSPRCEAHPPKEDVMNFLRTPTAVTRLNAGGMMRRHLPTVLGWRYPLAPLACDQPAQQFALASDMTDTRDGDLTRCCHRLLWAAIARRADIYSSIQTATAAYLAVYITSHLIAVFILGRMFLGIDTTFEWASGAPTGLLHDPWNVRLIPHYSLAPLFVISHLAMGLRGILLGHGVRAAFANRLAWVICAIGLGVSLVIAVAQLSVRS